MQLEGRRRRGLGDGGWRLGNGDSALVMPGTHIVDLYLVETGLDNNALLLV